MLGHTITSLGEEVNAYGNAVAKTTDQTQALLNLQISSTERFATDVKDLEVAQTRKEYFNILGSGFATTSEKDYYLGVLGKKLKMLKDSLAGLGYDELGRPLATPGGTPTRPGGTTTTTSIPVIRRQHGGPALGRSTLPRRRARSRSGDAAPEWHRAPVQGRRGATPLPITSSSTPRRPTRPRWRVTWCRISGRPISPVAGLEGSRCIRRSRKQGCLPSR